MRGAVLGRSKDGEVFQRVCGRFLFRCSFLQNISVSDRYGLAVCSANGIVFLGLAGLWFREAAAPKNRFEVQARPAWRYWPLLPAILAFWEPINPTTLGPDFNPVYLLTSGAALSFCLATPLYLAVLCIHFPQVNKTVLIATAFTGALMAFGNLVLEFVILPDYWWIGILHIPLLILSCYAILLSYNGLAAGLDGVLIQESTSQVTGLDRQDARSS